MQRIIVKEHKSYDFSIILKPYSAGDGSIQEIENCL